MTKIKKVCLKCILKIKFTIFAENLESIFIYPQIRNRPHKMTQRSKR